MWENDLIKDLAKSWEEGDDIAFSTLRRARAAYEEYKEKDQEYVQDVLETITLRKQAPRRVLMTISKGAWAYMSVEDKKEFLWKLGWDTKRFDYAEALGWFSYLEKKYAGYYIVGQERTDEEWVNTWVGGVRVASMEAQLAYRKDFSLNRRLKELGRRG